MLEWIKEHPYLSGGLVLSVIVYFVVRRSSSNASVSSGPSDSVVQSELAAQVANNQVSQAATSQTQMLQAQLASEQLQADAAVQIARAQTVPQTQAVQASADIASLNAQAQIAGAGLAAGVANNQTNVTGRSTDLATGDQLQALLAQFGTASSIATTQAGVTQAQIAAELDAQNHITAASVTNNTTNNVTQKYLGNLAATVQKFLSSNSLAAAKDLNSTNLAVVNSNNGTVQAVTRIQAGVSMQQLDDALKAILSNNSTTVTESGDTAMTAQHNTDVVAGLYNTLLNNNFITSQTQLQDQVDQNASILNAVKGTNFNLGGEGGKNVTSIYQSLLGNFNAGTVAAASTGPANPIAGIISSIAQLFGSAGQGVAAGLKAS